MLGFGFALLGTLLLSSGSGTASPAPAGVAQARTSFGLVAVDATSRSRGPLIAGGHHHTASFEGERLELAVRVENRLGRPVVVSPGLFRLRVGGAHGSTYAAASRLLPRPLAPGATFRARLAFALPARAGALDVEFEDIGRARPVELAIGRVGRPENGGARP